jgi:PAS domain S-box-containing protein
MFLEKPIQWDLLIEALRINFEGFAIGIFFVTPLLIIHVGPWLESVLFGIRAEKQALGDRQAPIRINSQSLMFAVSFICLAALAVWMIFINDVPEAFSIFVLLSAPLVWVALRRGSEGLSIAAPLLLAACIAALVQFDKNPDSAYKLLNILLAASLNAYIIAVGVTQTRTIDSQMERRDAILDAVSHAAQEFLGNTGWEAGVREAIRRLGEATSVTRVYLIDNRSPNLGGQVGDTHLYEWTNPSLTTDESDQRILDLLRRQMIEDFGDRFSRGQPYMFQTKHMDRKRQEMLKTLGIRSGVVIPMFVEGQWWGCLGLEQCFVNRDWPKSEIDGLKMGGQILGTLIASVRVEQQFRQLTGNIQAVFWISSPDGRTKQYVSPGYEEVWGHSLESLQRNPGSWLQAIHPEDRTRVAEALVKQVWSEYDEEYRLERPDGSLRWIHDRGFPVRDQTGRVDRIVGIAEDITKQKEVEEKLRAATVMLSTLINHLHSGVLVEDDSRKITHVNQAFTDIFNVPVLPESLFGIDSRLLFVQTAQFADRIEQVIRDNTPILGEEIEWQKRIFLRNYVPLLIDEGKHFHLWQYQDITESRQAEEQIKSSLKEKEVLLKEIHHRVKNNLQIISSLLNLQGTEIEEAVASQKFKESQDRVKAMALIHERLYQSHDLAKIDFSGYVRNLTTHLMRSYKIDARATRLNLEVDSVAMNLDVAIPCGLIINELVSNAFKYAFPECGEGDIRVCFGEGPDRTLKLVVSDNGVGFPEDLNPETSDSLGLKLVQSLTGQMGGDITFHNRNGLKCEIIIPHAKA